MKENVNWIYKVFLLSFILSIVFSSGSSFVANRASSFVLGVIIIIVIAVGIIFDMIGVEFLTSNDLYMTLDVGHANHVGYSADDMIFDCIKHVHMHDNFGDDDAHLPLGEGSIDLKRVVNNLESKKYDGIYILEVNDYDSIKKSNEYMKENF